MLVHFLVEEIAPPEQSVHQKEVFLRIFFVM